MKLFFTLIFLSICSNILSTPTAESPDSIATKTEVNDDNDDDIAAISSTIREKRDYFQSQHQNLYPTNYNRQYSTQPQQQYARQYNNYNADANAPILRQIDEKLSDGSYNYEYETGNGIRARQSSIQDGDDKVVSGSYSYVGPDSVTYTVNYVADRFGYRAYGEHLPAQPYDIETVRRDAERFGFDFVDAKRFGISRQTQSPYAYGRVPQRTTVPQAYDFSRTQIPSTIQPPFISSTGVPNPYSSNAIQPQFGFSSTHVPPSEFSSPAYSSTQFVNTTPRPYSSTSVQPLFGISSTSTQAPPQPSPSSPFGPSFVSPTTGRPYAQQPSFASSTTERPFSQSTPTAPTFLSSLPTYTPAHLNFNNNNNNNYPTSTIRPQFSNTNFQSPTVFPTVRPPNPSFLPPYESFDNRDNNFISQQQQQQHQQTLFSTPSSLNVDDTVYITPPSQQLQPQYQRRIIPSSSSSSLAQSSFINAADRHQQNIIHTDILPPYFQSPTRRLLLDNPPNYQNNFGIVDDVPRNVRPLITNERERISAPNFSYNSNIYGSNNNRFNK